jgi:hypothetical protein
MKLNNRPLRNLVKHFASGNIDRKTYLDIRARLLQRLEEHGSLTDRDLESLLGSSEETTAPPAAPKSYSRSDWILILLGLGAALALGAILYG